MSVQGTVESDVPFGLMRALRKARRPQNKSPEFEDPAIQAGSNLRTSNVDDAQKNSQPAPVQDGKETWPLPGLAPMTRVRTSFGDVHSIALRKGDEVLTGSGEYLPILWINRIRLDEHILTLKPDSNPIVIGAGSLGPGAPATEIMVSPRQIIAADDKSGLATPREAAMLTSRPGVRRLHETGLTYTVFHVGQAAEVYVEGLFLQFPLEA
ncbi:MAG: hypothetical protein HKN18_15715 [Silicimonas sp.]|nr:hypothetical protein [Silicimonas sp.]